MTPPRIYCPGPTDLPALARLKARSAWTIPADRPFLRANPGAARHLDPGLWYLAVAGTDGPMAFVATRRDGAGHWTIEELFTDPGHMRAGHARRLVERVIAEARGAGVAVLLVDANPAAQGFYTALGFVPAQEVKDAAGIGLKLPLL